MMGFENDTHWNSLFLLLNVTLGEGGVKRSISVTHHSPLTRPVFRSIGVKGWHNRSPTLCWKKETTKGYESCIHFSLETHRTAR